MDYRLGLDVGTNSLGWSVFETNEDMEPVAIATVGARIFSDGRDHKSKSTLAADRRAARSARRLRDRYKRRRKNLLSALTDAGLFPAETDIAARAALQKINPLELRALAITQKLSPHEIGRALFHLNQRRGFKSNRKDKSQETVSGVVSNSARMLLQEMGLIEAPWSKEEYNDLSKEDKKQVLHEEAQAHSNALEKLAERNDLTLGSFLFARQKSGKPTRARPGAGDDGKLYDVYPTRELYEDEFEKLWTAQALYHPSLLTQRAKDLFHKIIFTQRPLKAQERGQCTYLNAERRTFRAMPSFQRYRIYQDVNNLEWQTSEGRNMLTDYPTARDAIVNLLEKPPAKKSGEIYPSKQILWRAMKKVLKAQGLAEDDIAFNFETPKRKGFDSNLTSNIMQHDDYVGAEWHSWDLQKQDAFIDLILDDELDDAEVQGHLISQYGLNAAAAARCMNAPLVEGTASISQKAAGLMLSKMRDGVMGEDGNLILPIQSLAAEIVAEEVDGFENPMRMKKLDEEDFVPLASLPYYGEAFQDGSHIIPGSHNEVDAGDDKKFYGGVTNPTVHIALNQIRQVINEVIERFGHPQSIAIELARDLPAGAERRNEWEREQKQNQDANEAIDKKLMELGQLINRDNRLRLRLWEELNEKDPAGRRCPFTGELIGVADLFNGETEIEHLIPHSLSLDDSRTNKVICTRRANRDKGQRTPFEAFGHSPDGYEWEDIFERVKGLPEAKRWRFQEDALEIWKGDHDDFLSRHLNDTRYIGRLAREYLSHICHTDKIDVLTGRLTSLLRGHWGLNSVLQGDNLPKDAQKKKNRDDHRHHAVDAIVIGMTSRSILQKVATAANRAEELNLDRLFPQDEKGHSAIEPWDGFRDAARAAVADMIVSHKVKRKKLRPDSTDGQLHNDTAYGIISGPDKNGRYEIVVRWPIDNFKTRAHVESIRDAHLRAAFLQAFDDAEAVGKKGHEGVLDVAKEKGIRRLRRTENGKIIAIQDSHGNSYKAYKGDSNWGMEIYAFPETDKKADKWQGVVISRFDANKPGFQPGTTYRPAADARLVMRLQINDCIEIEEAGEKRLLRLQKMSQDGNLVFAPLNEANVDARNRDKNDEFKYVSKVPNVLRTLRARKVHISPTGQVSYEGKRKPRRRKTKG